MTKPTNSDERVIARLFNISDQARQAALGELPTNKLARMRSTLLSIESQLREIRKELNFIEH